MVQGDADVAVSCAAARTLGQLCAGHDAGPTGPAGTPASWSYLPDTRSTKKKKPKTKQKRLLFGAARGQSREQARRGGEEG